MAAHGQALNHLFQRLPQAVLTEEVRAVHINLQALFPTFATKFISNLIFLLYHSFHVLVPCLAKKIRFFSENDRFVFLHQITLYCTHVIICPDQKSTFQRLAAARFIPTTTSY